jgi:hypothetical protein
MKKLGLKTGNKTEGYCGLAPTQRHRGWKWQPEKETRWLYLCHKYADQCFFKYGNYGGVTRSG